MTNATSTFITDATNWLHNYRRMADKYGIAMPLSSDTLAELSAIGDKIAKLNAEERSEETINELMAMRLGVHIDARYTDLRQALHYDTLNARQDNAVRDFLADNRLPRWLGN